MKVVLQKLFASPTVRTVSGLAGSNFLALGIGIIGTWLQARYVSPEDLGYFRTFSIITGYAFFLQLGLMDSLQRLYPYCIGKGQRDQAIAVAEICQAWNVIVAVVLGAAFVLYGALMFAHGNWRAGLGCLAQAAAVADFFYNGYLGVTYRSGNDFAKVAKAGVISSAVNLLVLPLFPICSYFALALRSCLGSVCALGYLHRHRPLRLRWRFNVQEAMRYAKEGMLIFSAGYGRTTAFTVAQTTLIVHYLGTSALGLFSFSTMATDMASKLPQAVIAVYTPKLTEQYGRTHDIGACLRLCRKPMLWGSIGMLCCAALFCAILPPAVRILMPRYTEAVPTMLLLMLTLPLLILEMPYIVLVATGKVGAQNVASYGGLGLLLIFSFIAIGLGFGLNGVVAASLIGRAARLALIYAFIFSAYRQGRKGEKKGSGLDFGTQPVPGGAHDNDKKEEQCTEIAITE